MTTALPTFLMFGASFWCAFELQKALRTGSALSRSWISRKDVLKSEDPMRFWGSVIVLIVVGIAIFAMAATRALSTL
jgi:hypothetical protein